MVRARNSGLKPGYRPGTLAAVTCFRGQPNPRFDREMHRRTDAQRSAWEKSDPRVKVVYRPLKYVTRKTGYSTDHRTTSYEIESVTEKGIDVLCATAVLTESLKPEIDVVILASQDTDLAPCLDAALELGRAKIETVQWWNPEGRTVGHLQPISGRRIWNTRMGGDSFRSSIDPVYY